MSQPLITPATPEAAASRRLPRPARPRGRHTKISFGAFGLVMLPASDARLAPAARRAAQPGEDALRDLADRFDARGAPALLPSGVDRHARERAAAPTKTSSPDKDSELSVRHAADLAQTIAEAVRAEARRTSCKRFALDAHVSEPRAKQLRAEPSDVRASTLIALAQRRPELRSLLVDLMHAEMGDGGSPALILDRIARMFR